MVVAASVGEGLCTGARIRRGMRSSAEPHSAPLAEETAQGTLVRVEVTSDTVCPWCYVGKKNLEAAISQLPDDVIVEVTWHPYQMNPKLTREGVVKADLYRKKFGARMEAVMAGIGQKFAEHGQQFSTEGLTGSTIDSHRLLWYALHGPQGSPQLQNALNEEIMLDYFTRAKFIADRDALVAAAERVGLKGAREFLEDETAGLKEVQEELVEYGKGVTGVPFYRIGDQSLSGAQPTQVLLEVLKNVSQMAAYTCT